MLDYWQVYLDGLQLTVRLITYDNDKSFVNDVFATHNDAVDAVAKAFASGATISGNPSQTSATTAYLSSLAGTTKDDKVDTKFILFAPPNAAYR